MNNKTGELGNQIIDDMYSHVDFNMDFHKYEDAESRFKTILNRLKIYRRKFITGAIAAGPFKPAWINLRPLFAHDWFNDSQLGHSVDDFDTLRLCFDVGEVQCKLEKDGEFLNVCYFDGYTLERYEKALFSTWSYETGENLRKTGSGLAAYWIIDPNWSHIFKKVAEQIYNLSLPLIKDQKKAPILKKALQLTSKNKPGILEWSYLSSLDSVIKEFEMLLCEQKTKPAKKNRPTKADMVIRNKAVVMAATEIKMKYDRLATVADIIEETKLTPNQIYATAAYKDGKIAKSSAKTTAEITGNSIIGSERFKDGSSEQSRVIRKTKSDQILRDQLIDESKEDAANDEKQHKRYLSNKNKIDAEKY